MAKVQPVYSTPPRSRTIEGMMVVIMFSHPAWNTMPRLMKQKRARSPVSHSARQLTSVALWVVIAPFPASIARPDCVSGRGSVLRRQGGDPAGASLKGFSEDPQRYVKILRRGA